MPGGERYFIFLKSAVLSIGDLNQPSGSGPIGWTMNGSTLTLRMSAVEACGRGRSRRLRRARRRATAGRGRHRRRPSGWRTGRRSGSCRTSSGSRRSRLDDALVDRVEDLEGRHDGAVGQHFHLEPAVGHLVDPVAEALEQFEVDAGRRHRRLDPHLHRLRRLGDGRRREHDRADRPRRQSRQPLVLHGSSLVFRGKRSGSPPATLGAPPASSIR